MQQYNPVNVQYFNFYSVDKNNQIIEQLKCVEEGGKISYNSLDSLKMSASINVSLGIEEEFNVSRLKITCVTNGEEEICGIFLVSSPSSAKKVGMQNIDVTCYSLLWPLKADGPDYRYFVPQGTNAANEVKRILDKFDIPYIITDSEKTTSKGIEWEIGKSYLDIINDLLESINYTSLYITLEGTLKAVPYILPSKRKVEIIYDEDDVLNILEPTLKSELDLFNVPNKFVRYVNDPVLDLKATYINTIGITGTETTGITTTSFEAVEASDYDTLYEICKKAAETATSVYHKLTFYTAINLQHLFMNCIQVNLLGVNTKVVETSWELELKSGGSMEHNVREVIQC